MATFNHGNDFNTNKEILKRESTSSDEDSDLVRKQNFSDVLKRVFDEEFQDSLKTFSNDEKFLDKVTEIGRVLNSISDEFQNTHYLRRNSYDRTKNTVDNLFSKYSEKYKVLQGMVDEWLPNRNMLIQNLSNYIYQLDRNFKWSTVARLAASSVEVSGTVGGLMFRSDAGWANQALNVASFCGMCGLISTVVEVEQSKKILDEVSEAVENDYKLLLPIVKWFEETKELDSIVQELFPHGIDTDIVRQIQAASAEQEDYLKIFKAGLMSNIRKDTELLGNVDFLHSLQLFATSQAATVWWNRIVHRKHPITLDLGRMALQIEFGQLQSIVFQCIPALPLEQQRLSSLPVAGRIMLNALTLYDSFVDLKKGAKSTHSDKLRKHLKNMKEQLELIENTIRFMDPHVR